jgi:predicted 3-demethylubiquinone-9 3-methyltransferase (glyoxalase superfamily)
VDLPIAPAFLFPDGASEAVNFYRSVFPDAELLGESTNSDGSHLASNLKIRGVEFVFISGGPPCSFSMATSFMLYCHEQSEIDALWDALKDGAEIHACGWITDKFGITWQVTPAKMQHWMTSGTKEQASAAMGALMQQEKVNLAEIEAAWHAAAN